MKTPVCLAIVILSTAVFAQQDLPFDKYPVSSVYKGRPAPARPTTKFQLRFQTVIRKGAEKGPNFAGHFTVVIWGCGTACAQFAIVDAATGNVFDPPFSGVSFGTDTGQYFQQSGIHYQLNSSLLVIQGCPDEKNCAQYLYNWTGEKLQQVGTTPLTPLPRR